MSLATGFRWSSGQDLALSRPLPDLILWLGAETLLQATVGQGHLRSRGQERPQKGGGVFAAESYRIMLYKGDINLAEGTVLTEEKMKKKRTKV